MSDSSKRLRNEDAETETVEIVENFANYLLDYRKNNNLTQDDIAEKLGVSKQHISNIERGIYFPTLDRMVRSYKLLNNNSFSRLGFAKTVGLLTSDVINSNSILQELQGKLKHLEEDNSRLKKMVDRIL